MPEISRFLGIVIAIFYRDHVPPHFHAKYGEFEITVGIETGIVSGQLSRAHDSQYRGQTIPHPLVAWVVDHSVTVLSSVAHRLSVPFSRGRIRL
ncbi:MAG: DUF4160 domain-containing protein [Ignavibacteriae bacterium]|nr:DUF4160 domain-containing protein [Ignavibacteriota bacterium]